MSHVHELKSMISSFSSPPPSNGSQTALATCRQWRNVALHERCSVEDMLRLRDCFRASDNGVMFPDQFQDLLRNELNVEYDEDAFHILFLKINTNRDGAITWDELVSHLLLGYFTNDPDNQRDSLEPPILGLPRVIRSQHRHPITSITFCPDINKDRSREAVGMYLTASREGMINWWSLNMAKLRTTYSTSPILKVRQTWVTSIVCLPDVSIVVTSSTERDLRFYDCAAATFTLKIIITSWQYMICTMHYHFEQDESQQCLLVLGDVGGSVRVLSFSPVERGPFRSQAARALIRLRHVDLQRRASTALPGMHLKEFPSCHGEWVRQVSYYRSLHCLVSCATGPDSLLMQDLQGSKTHNMFRVEKGINCFAFDEETHVLCTGGPDCTVRVWSPFVPGAPSAVLEGHHAGIVGLVLQDHGQRLYSIARDRTIKVWDTISQELIQTYIDIPSEVGGHTPITSCYNAGTRDLVMGAIRIAVITLNEQLNPQHTDGSTHSKAVSKILYNPLFKVLVTCGMDSIIINWDPLTGKRNVMVRSAHTRLLHGELIPVEITAACFDSGYQLLLTGARDGTLKVWNFNNGECVRNMHVEHNQEITGVFWIEGRIFSIGWNRHVTEFQATGMADTGKPWETRHSEDVLVAAARPPLSLATASYNSELVFWKLETGQPYRRFSCTDPTLRIKMHYGKRELAAAKGEGGKGGKGGAAAKRPALPESSVRVPSCVVREAAPSAAAAVTKALARRKGLLGLPPRDVAMRPLAVHAMLFLETRPFSSQTASLMVALENGRIQAWSDHPAGGIQGSFQGVHTAGDYVSALATDVNNRFLFTGTTVGYVKVWLMTNYLSGTEEDHVCMPELRLQFPFLWRDRIEGRAKRSVRDQPLPVLLNSYRAHMRSITTMAYIDDNKIVITGSADYSVRLWRLSGEYLQTLGSFLPWTLESTRFPPDVRKVASYTTFKVWRHGVVSRYVPGQVPVDPLRDVTEAECRRVYGRPLEPPLLGRYTQLPPRPERQETVRLDDTFATIPLYAHLRMASTVPVRRPPTPELVRRTRLAGGRKARFEPQTRRGSHAARDSTAGQPAAAAAAVKRTSKDKGK